MLTFSIKLQDSSFWIYLFFVGLWQKSNSVSKILMFRTQDLSAQRNFNSKYQSSNKKQQKSYQKCNQHHLSFRPADEEIDEVQLPIHSWNAQFTSIDVPVGKGVLNVKGRRKPIMQLDNDNSDQQMIQYEDIAKKPNKGGYANLQVQQKQYTGSSRFKSRNNEHMLIKSSQKSFYGGNIQGRNSKSILNVQSNSQSINQGNEQLLQQLAKTKKSLEDNIYLNNKLKNDRDVLMKKVQDMEHEIQNLLIQLSKDVATLRQHYENRMIIRQEIIEEEIQELVSVLNGNAESSKKVVEQILRQKAKLQQEIKEIQDNFKGKITSLQIQLSKKQKQFNDYRHQWQGDLQQINQEMKKKLQQNQRQLKIKIQLAQKEKQAILEQIQVYKVQFQKSRINNESIEEEMMKKSKYIEQKERELQQKNRSIQEKNKEIKSVQINFQQLREMVKLEQEKIQGLQRQIQVYEEEKAKDKQEIIDLNGKILETNGQLEQMTYELQFNEDVLKQLKVQSQQKQQELYGQLQNIEKIYNDKIQEIVRRLNLKIQQQHHQNNELRQKLGMSQKQLTQYQSQLNEKQSQLQSYKQSGIQAQQKQDKVRKLQTQNQKIKRELQERMSQMKKQYDNQNKNLIQKTKELQAQIQQLRRKLNNEQSKLTEVKRQYQQKIQILNSQKGHPKRSDESLDKSKDKIQKVNKSIQLSKFGSLQASKNDISRHQISLAQIDPQQIQEIMIQKDDQIQALHRKLDQVHELCSKLQAKLNLIASKYPDIDMDNLNVDYNSKHYKSTGSMKILQYCDSEKQEQQKLNRDLIQKQAKNASKPHTPQTKKNGNQQVISFQRKESFLNRKNSIGMQGSKQLSQYSNASYVRVSHTNKLKDQEKQIQQLQERQKKYQEEIQKYLIQIQQLNHDLNEIKVQLQDVINKSSENAMIAHQYDILKKQQQSLKIQLDKKIKEDIPKLKEKQKKLQDELKQMEKLQAQNKEKITIYEIKLNESVKRQKDFDEFSKKSKQKLQQLLRKIADFQNKIRQQKQAQQQIRMQNRQLIFINQQSTNEMKKYKALAEEYEQKLKKNAGNDIMIRELQKQIQDWNRKNLEFIRNSNHMKLQKDSLEEEMKILKKRYGEQSRVAIQWQEKASSLQRTIQQLKRKEGKFKRQIEDAQQQTRKTKQTLKKIEEELHSLQTLQSSHLYQKKKQMDEVAQLQDQLTRKQYELSRVLKQLQKHRHKMEENQDVRVGKKNQLRYEIQKLQAELIRKQKKSMEDGQQIKMLMGRLQFLQKQNKKIMQQKTQTYGDKLKYYIDQIASIKKLLDEYQSQNTKLKLQNSQFFEQNELLKLSLSKLQNKYQQNIENQENILTDLQHYMDEVASLSQKIRTYQLELDRLQSSYAAARKQFDDQRINNKKKTDRLETAQKSNERLMEQLKQLKIRFSQVETQANIHFNINQKYKALDRKKAQLQQQLKKVKTQYERVISIFIYKKEDLQKVVNDVRVQQRKAKQEQLAAAIQEVSKSSNIKITRFQAQILDLFNQNSKLRQQIQSKAQQVALLKLRITELQPLNNRVQMLQKQKQDLAQQIEDKKEQIKRKNQKLSKDQFYIGQLQRALQTKQAELTSTLSNLGDLEMKNERLTAKLENLQQKQDSLQEQVRELLQKQKQRAQEQIAAQKLTQSKNSQTFEHKLFQAELELAKLKQKQSVLSEQYSKKIRSLQKKIQEMSDTMKQHQKALQDHYEQQIRVNQETLVKLSEQLQDKLRRIDQLNQALIILQHQNQDLSKQLSNVRYKLDEQTEIFNIQYGKLKSKLKDSEDVYNQNMKNLQQELATMGKELTMAKYKRDQLNNSKLKNSEVQDKKAIKRLDQKMKQKDKKIQQLKSNIYILEETVLKLRKKQTGTEMMNSELQKLKFAYNELQQQYKNSQQMLRTQNELLQQTVRQLKKQILQAKQTQEKATILLQEKIMEMQSIQSQLKTTKQLYSELQKQIDRRKLVLTNQMEEESSLLAELHKKQTRLSQIQDQLIQLKKQFDQSQAQLNKKNIQNRKLNQLLKSLSQAQVKMKNLSNQSTTQEILLKGQLQQKNSLLKVLENQNRNLKLQIGKFKKNNEQLKSQILTVESSLAQYENAIENFNHKIKEQDSIVRIYYQINQKVKNTFGISIQQAVQTRYWQSMLEQKQQEIGQLIQEVEQLKFLQDRKLLDYDQLKKQNYQLSLKAEDNQILTEQVDNLRRICDKLEQQKKGSVFRQQLMKMQLYNMVQNSQNQQTKGKIQSILRNCNVSVGYGFHQNSFGNY